MKIKQHFVPYWLWEDFLNGMWRKVENENEFLEICIEFTGDHFVYGSAMKEVLYVWPKTMLNSLTNKSINRRAFLGHCAAQFKINCPEYITRMAWKQLTDKQRLDADNIAEETIQFWEKNIYETEVRKLRSRMGKQMLLEWLAG